MLQRLPDIGRCLYNAMFASNKAQEHCKLQISELLYSLDQVIRLNGVHNAQKIVCDGDLRQYALRSRVERRT